MMESVCQFICSTHMQMGILSKLVIVHLFFLTTLPCSASIATIGEGGLMPLIVLYNLL